MPEVMLMTYEDAVTLAAGALKRGEEANWELARLTYENTKNGNGKGQPERKSLAEWSADIEAASGRKFSRTTASYYRQVWALAFTSVNANLSFQDAYWEVRGTTKEEMFDERYAAHVTDRAAPEVQVKTFEKLLETPAVRAALEQRPELSIKVDNVVETAHRATHPPQPRLAPDRYWSLEGQLFQVFTKLYWAYGKVQDGTVEIERREALIRQAEQAADWASALASLLKGESPARELLDDIDSMLQEARGNV